jgi:hypothetical protein
MKIFWAMIGVLLAAAVAVFVLGRGERTASPNVTTNHQTTPHPSDIAPPTLALINRPSFNDAPSPPEPTDHQNDSTPPAEPWEYLSTPEPPAAHPAENAPPGEPAPVPPDTADEVVEEKSPDAAPAENLPAHAPAPAPVEAAHARPALTLLRRDDGTLLVNDRWVIKGEGTSEKPYELTWEYLISAGETYDPRAGQNELPPHIAMLDGKHVRITGWIAFPLYVQSATELLVMLNQWDGCCIGVPPTPYDAVEVNLRAPAEGDLRQAAFGTVQGVMGVKPYVVGGWLVGLYIMDQARIIPGRFNDGGS